MHDQYHLARWAARGMRGRVNVLALAANFSQNSLYNNSTGAEVLVVRNISPGQGGSNSMFVQWARGQVGTHTGIEVSVQPDRAVKPGQLFGFQTTTTPITDWDGFQFTTPLFVTPDFPLAIIPPNWSLLVSRQAANVVCSTAWLWDAVPAQELVDFGIDPMVLNAPPRI